MARRVSAFYRNRALAEEAATRLTEMGRDELRPTVSRHDPPEIDEPGMFDRLAKMLARDVEARESGYVVDVEVASEQIDTVALALEAGAERVEMSTPPRFGEQVIQLSETAEQLVVEKETVLREEIVMRVQATERVQEVHDTVRRTEVEVDEGKSGSAFGFDGNRDRNN